MNEPTVLHRLLKFNGFRIVRFWFNEAGELMLAVKPHGNGRRCPHCGRRCRLVKSSPIERRWRELVVCETPIWIGVHSAFVLTKTYICTPERMEREGYLAQISNRHSSGKF
jgi:hypothetical protein